MCKGIVQGVLAGLLVFISHTSQALTIEPDGPFQAPLIYVHGYIDDGTSWARDTLYEVEDKLTPMSIKYFRHYVFGPDRSPSAFFTRNGIENWAVQWWAEDGFNTYSTADEGYAFLQDSQQLLDGTNWVQGTWTAQNRPIPSALDVLTASEIDIALGLAPIPSNILGLPTSLLVKAGIASQLRIRSTYQDSGRVDPRAQDFLEMIRAEKRQQGKLSRYRQVNIITHSMGSLVARAMLDKAHNASVQDSESVANVIYNAPPFAGSTMAYLAKLYFEPVTLDSSMFEDERVQLMLSTSATTAKDLVINYINLLVRPLGVEYSNLEAGFNQTTRNAIDLLFLIPINDIVDPAFINSLSGTFTGDAIVAAMQFARPFVAALLGVSGVPGHDDLTPEGGLAHITDYTTNPEVKQFVTLGTRGFGVHLFPDDLEAVASNPALIIDNSVLVAQDDDTAVAEGSARLLTTTDNFGPRMTLLDEFDLEHPDLLYRNLPEMGPLWLETFLAPASSMEITGDVETINSASRSFLIKESGASFSFLSETIERSLDFPVSDFLPFGETVNISVSAESYEFRLVSDDGSSILQNWNEVTPSQNIAIDDLVTSNNLQDLPFYIEWRSINQRGGREMIRSARFVVASEAPQLVDSYILGSESSQIFRTQRSAVVGDNAIRGQVFGTLVNTSGAVLLSSITDRPEASWVISNASNKALTLLFDKSADLRFQWEDSSLQNPVVVSNVPGHLIELEGLQEGVNTLYFQTINPVNSTVESPVQKIRIQVDNRPPQVNFELTENHPLGIVVGPLTPLTFNIQDIGSNAASGELVVAGNSEWIFQSGQTFSLQQTGLKEQMELAAIVGGTVEMTITSEDQVGNLATETHSVYYDISAPEVSLEQLTPVVQIDTDEYQLFTAEVEIVINAADSGSGLSGAIPVVIISGEESGYQISNELTLGGVAGFPQQYGGTLALPFGRNRITTAMTDFAGNTGVLDITIERIDPVIQDTELTIINPRLDSATCFNPAGDVVNCTPGSVDEISMSLNGEVVAFSSSGNKYVRNDNNRSKDIFVWSGGDLQIASRNSNGELANDDSQRPVVSGNGRYVYFESSADNLAKNAEDFNLYVKDLETGQLAVVSLGVTNMPINIGLQGNFYASTTYSGRYVFFSSRNSTYVKEFVNPGTQVYMVDLDSDEDGNFFNNDYVTTAVSNINDNTMPALASEYPKVTQDGRYVVFNSRSDGALRLIKFAGTDAEGNLDSSSRTETLIANSGGSVFDIAPFSDDIAFLTTRNLLPQDDNQEFVDSDIYLSRGEFAGGSFFSRSLELKSIGQGGVASDMDTAFPIQDVSIGQDKLVTSTGVKVGWVSSHNNIVSGDNNATEDLFIRREPSILPINFIIASNWITDSLPANAHVRTGRVAPDGRYAFWITQQEYIPPFSSDGLINFYRRRLESPQSHTLDIQIEGNGEVILSSTGEALSDGFYQFDNEEKLTLKAIAGPGFALAEWQGDATGSEAGKTIWMTEDRNISIVFEQLPGPLSASAQLTTESGQESSGVEPVISFEGDAIFALTIEQQPANGVAFTRGGLLYYTAEDGFAGSDSFEFQVTNNRGVKLPMAAIAAVEVVFPNRSPTAALLQIETLANQASQRILPIVEDPDDNDVFDFALLSVANNGIVTLTSDGFAYTPDIDFIGEDSFSYQVVDSAGNTLTTIGLVTVRATTDQDGESSSGGGGSAGLSFLLLLLMSCFKTVRTNSFVRTRNN